MNNGLSDVFVYGEADDGGSAVIKYKGNAAEYAKKYKIPVAEI